MSFVGGPSTQVSHLTMVIQFVLNQTYLSQKGLKFDIS